MQKHVFNVIFDCYDLGILTRVSHFFCSTFLTKDVQMLNYLCTYLISETYRPITRNQIEVTDKMKQIDLRNVTSCCYEQSWRYRRPQARGWPAQSGPQGNPSSAITNEQLGRNTVIRAN